MKLLRLFWLLCLSATCCMAFSQGATSHLAPAAASINSLKQKIDRLKELGLLVAYPDGLHHTEFSRYEAAVAAYAGLQEYKRLWADPKRRSKAENRQVLLQGYEDIEGLIRATPRELKSLGVDLNKTNTELDRIAAELKTAGFSIRRVQGLTFPDVPSNHWAADAVQILHKAGLIRGYPDGLFRGN